MNFPQIFKKQHADVPPIIIYNYIPIKLLQTFIKVCIFTVKKSFYGSKYAHQWLEKCAYTSCL